MKRKAAKDFKGSPEEFEEMLKEQVKNDIIQEWRIQCANSVLGFQERVKKVRLTFATRQRKHNRKFKHHIKKNTQATFIEMFSKDLANYHRRMGDVGKKKKKDLWRVLGAVETYDFFFRDVIMTELLRDQT